MPRPVFFFETSCEPALRKMGTEPASAIALEKLALGGRCVLAAGGAAKAPEIWSRSAGGWCEAGASDLPVSGTETVKVTAVSPGRWEIGCSGDEKKGFFTGSLEELAEELLCRAAARVLKAGGLVALPTETVYGLGADAANPRAVARIFEVKGRPTGHPLIVHLADAAAMPQWAVNVPDLAWKLAAGCWPGPLTLILSRSPQVSDRVTGGQNTVGLRVPDHPLTRRVLQEFAGGVAAPSANRFGRVSPTTAEHVREDLGEDVDFVLDGGACAVGVESSIVDLSGHTPVLLRPGGWPREFLEEVAGCPIPPGAGTSRAPGSHASHYAPRARVRLVKEDRLHAEMESLRSAGLKVKQVSAEARSLYADFREADRQGVEVLLVVLPELRGLGAAVADRLTRAAHQEESPPAGPER